MLILAVSLDLKQKNRGSKEKNTQSFTKLKSYATLQIAVYFYILNHLAVISLFHRWNITPDWGVRIPPCMMF